MTEVKSANQMPSYEAAVGVLKKEQPKAQITDIRVLLTYSEIDERRKEDAQGPDLKVKQSHQLHGTNAIAVRTEMITTIPIEPDQGVDGPKLMVARFRFALGLTYTFSESPSEDARTYFGRIQGVHQSWPYFRTHLHSVCGLMGFSPAPIAPLLAQSEAAKLAGFVSSPEKASSSQANSPSRSASQSPSSSKRSKS